MNGLWYIEAPDVPAGAWRKSAYGSVRKAYAYWQEHLTRVRIVDPNGREVGSITSGGYWIRLDPVLRKAADALDNR